MSTSARRGRGQPGQADLGLSCAKSYRSRCRPTRPTGAASTRPPPARAASTISRSAGTPAMSGFSAQLRCRTDARQGIFAAGVPGLRTRAATPSAKHPGNARPVTAPRPAQPYLWTGLDRQHGRRRLRHLPRRPAREAVSGTTCRPRVTGLTPNTSYGFYVNARDAAGNVSQASNTVAVKTPPQVDNKPPTAPKTCAPQASPANSVSLAWNASTDNIGVTGYNVFTGTTQVGSATAHHHDHQRPDSRTRPTPSRSKRPTTPGTPSPASNPITVTTKRRLQHAIGKVKQISTSADVPWGLVNLPDGTVLYNERDTHKIIHVTQSGTKTTVGTIANVPERTVKAACSAWRSRRLSAADHWLYVCHTSPTRQPDHPRSSTRTARSARRSSPAHRDHAQQVPQRRPAAVRAGRQAVRRSRRRPERQQRAGPQLAQRKDAATQPGRLRSVGQPVRR